MNRTELINALVKDGLLEQRVRIQISPSHSYNRDDIGKICDKYDITEEELSALLDILPWHAEEDTLYKETFGFFKFENTFDELEFIFSEGKIIDLGNPEIRKQVVV